MQSTRRLQLPELTDGEIRGDLTSFETSQILHFRNKSMNSIQQKVPYTWTDTIRYFCLYHLLVVGLFEPISNTVIGTKGMNSPAPLRRLLTGDIVPEIQVSGRIANGIGLSPMSMRPPTWLKMTDFSMVKNRKLRYAWVTQGMAKDCQAKDWLKVLGRRKM